MQTRNLGVMPRVVRAAGPWLCVVALAIPRETLSAELSLPQAVERAVARAPLLDARLSQLEAARQDARRAGALPDPMLAVGVDNLPVTGRDAFDTRADEMTMARIGLRQEFPARAKRETARAVAERRSQEAVAGVRAERLAVQQATTEAWIELWAAQREQVVLATLRGQAELSARLSKARVGAGTETVPEALAAQAAVVELDNRIESARARAEAARAGLAGWLGEDVGRVADAAPGFASLPVPEGQLLAHVEHSIPLLPATAQVETAAAQVDAARADRRSDWSVSAAYGRRAEERSDMLTLEVGIGLPLFRRNRQDRGVAAREADYQAALALREHLRRQQTARVRADIARWQAMKRQMALYEQSLLPLAKDRSAAALAAYEAGGPLRPWLDARRDELDADLAHLEHVAELGRSWAALAYLLPTAETSP